MARKTDSVDSYIASRSAEVATLLNDLRSFIHNRLPGTSEEMQFGVPVFLNAHGVPVIYLYGSKKHVNFGFLRSTDLTDPEGVLKGSGTPSKHIRVLPGRPIETKALAEFVDQCAAIAS